MNFSLTPGSDELPKDIDLVRMAKESIESELKLTIMCGPLTTLEDRLRIAISRSAELLEKAVRLEIQNKEGQKHGKRGG